MYNIHQLTPNDRYEIGQAIKLISLTYPNNPKYEHDRLVAELNSIQDTLNWDYRSFFVATVGPVVVGVGGVKAADWASDTHLLYLGVVAEHYRGQGIGKALELARINWVKNTFVNGRILVSTHHRKRFSKHAFELVSTVNDKHLMCLNF